MSGPLKGIRVIEVASIVLGPMAGQYLGDMGADVIKVETPEGDLTRSQGPKRPEKMSGFFLACNRNKRSIVLDLNAVEGRNVLHKLVQSADVLLHSIRSPTAAKIGLGYQTESKAELGFGEAEVDAIIRHKTGIS